MKHATKKTGFASVRINPDLLEEVRVIAAENYRTIAAQIVFFVAAGVNEYRVKTRGIASVPVKSSPRFTTEVKERQA